MLGCNKCNAIYHKDTRYGPRVWSDGVDKPRTPKSIKGRTKINQSRCKKYSIEGSKDDESITFESGPLTEGIVRSADAFEVWRKRNDQNTFTSF